MALTEPEATDLLKSLYKDWSAERIDIDLYERYYSGDHPLPQEPRRLTTAYREMLQMSVSNWTRLIVDVVAERLEVQAIASSKSSENDDKAWQWWQANNLDYHSNNVHTGALKHGVAFVAVGKPLEGTDFPRIIGQPATQVHVRYDPDRPDRPEAALKVWQGRDGYSYATVYDDEALYRFRSQGKTADTSGSAAYTPVVVAGGDVSWEIRENDDDGGWMLPNELQRVPFVRFACQPDLLGGYSSEIAPVVHIQDRINKTTFHRLLAQEFTAFPQRWVTGIDIPIDPETEEPVEPFEQAVDRLWAATDPETTFGQFPAGDSAAYIAAISADVQALATQSRTPPHYLTGGMGQFPSGESVRATEYGLSQKVRDRKTTFGESWGEVMRLAGAAMGDALAEDRAVVVRWEDVEARTEGEIVDALLKMRTLGVPLRILWERWGASPQEIDNWRRLALEEVAEIEGMSAVGVPTPEQQKAAEEATDGPTNPQDAKESAF